MKLWYQSLGGERSTSGYHNVLREILDKAKDPDTEIEIHGISNAGGAPIQYRYIEYLKTGEVMRNLQTAMGRGFDAFLIGNIADAGLQECREIANIPVLGLCETTMHLACMMGAAFSVVTINEKFVPRIVENAARYGLERRLISVRHMSVARSKDINDAYAGDGVHQSQTGRFLQAAEAAVAEGAEVIIPGGGGAMSMLAHQGVHSAGRGTPILNGIIALLKMGEMAVKLDRIMGGHFTSKRLSYAPPGSDQIDEIRKYYGNIYPTVQSRREIKQ